MSGSAAPKSTKGQQAFEPDFKAKEMVERDDTWFQKRFGTQADGKTGALNGELSSFCPSKASGAVIKELFAPCGMKD